MEYTLQTLWCWGQGGVPPFKNEQIANLLVYDVICYAPYAQEWLHRPRANFCQVCGPVEQQPLTASSTAYEGGARWGVSCALWLPPSPPPWLCSLGGHLSAATFHQLWCATCSNSLSLWSCSQSDLKLHNNLFVTNSVEQLFMNFIFIRCNQGYQVVLQLLPGNTRRDWLTISLGDITIKSVGKRVSKRAEEMDDWE